MKTQDGTMEAQYVAALAGGDVHAFNFFYYRYHKAVHANILKLVKNPELSAEILQDVFVSLWQNRHKIDVQKSVGGWLFVVSYNKSMNTLRKKLKESIEYCEDYPMDFTEDESVAVEETFAMQMQVLQEAVEVLPKRKQEVFKLCRYDGISRDDVAQQMGISAESVNDYLKQSNKAIRRYIAMNYPAYVSKCILFFLYLFFS